MKFYHVFLPAATAAAVLEKRDFELPPMNCETIYEDAHLARRMCVATSGLDTISGVELKIPFGYQNMKLEIYGASGGAALDANENIDPESRGLGVHFKADIAGLDPGTSHLHLFCGVNGQDATIDRPGRRQWSSSYQGEGGHCRNGAGNEFKRFGGAGGSSFTIYSSRNSFRLTLGAGGGAGGYDSAAQKSKGGNAALIRNGEITNGTDAISAEGLKTGGQGGHTHRQPGGEGFQGHDGGDSGPYAPGKGGSVDQNRNIGMRAVCLTGGGGGDGRFTGSGGGAVGEITRSFAAAAGGGGGGASVLGYKVHKSYDGIDGPSANIINIEQEHLYDPHPRAVITYDVDIRAAAAQKAAFEASREEWRRRESFWYRMKSIFG